MIFGLGRSGSDEFTGIEDSPGIKGTLEGGVHRAAHARSRLAPPWLLGDADPVLARDHAVPGQYLGEEFVQGCVHLPLHLAVGVVVRRHDVDVNIAVARMTEAGYREAVLF